MSGVAAAPQPRRRIAWAIAATLAVLLVVMVLIAVYLSRPQQATRLILNQLGAALGLEITASTGEYRLSGTPYLLVRDVVAREPGARTPILRARQASLSLPWSTIRARGSDLTVQRIELDRPVLDLAALQHWLRQRQPGKTRIPTLTDGLQVTNGTLLGDGWSVAAIGLRLPDLAPDKPVSAHIHGRYRTAGLQLPFALDVVMSVPAPDTTIGVAGDLAIERPGWRLPAHVVLSGALRTTGGLRLHRAKLAASARYEAGATREPFALGAGGTLRLEKGIRLEPAAISVRAQGLIPTLDAAGTVALGDGLQIALDGALASWPTKWPQLPTPLGQSRSPLPVQLLYSGNSDLSDVAHLGLQRDQARFDGRFRLDDVTRWLDASNAPPLPPLDGRFDAPEMEIAGARLEGVQVTLDDETLPEPLPAKMR